MIDSYTSAGVCGGITLMYNSVLKGRNKNIILKNNKATYTAGILITYVTQNNWVQDLSNIVFENNEVTNASNKYRENIYAYKSNPPGATGKDYDIYVHDCDFIGSAGIYQGTTYKKLTIDNVSFRDIDRYSANGWDSPIAQTNTGVSFEFTNSTMSNIKIGALLYSYYDYSPNITISNVNILNDSQSADINDKINKFAYFMYLFDETFANNANVVLNNMKIENTHFEIPIINKDNSSNAKFIVTAKDLKFKNTYGDYGLFFLNNFADGMFEFENINVDGYISEGNTNAYGVLHFENSVGSVKNLTVNNAKEYTPKPMLGVYSGSKINVEGDFSITNSTDVVALVEAYGDDTELTIEKPLVLTNNTMKPDSAYKTFNAIGLNVLSNAKVKLLDGANITENNVEDGGAVFIDDATLFVAGKVNIEKNTNAVVDKTINVYFASSYSNIEYMSGYDKLASTSVIYMTTNVPDITAFKYWNENSSISHNSEEVFKIDKKQENEGYRVYKYGTASNVELRIGQEFVKLIYKIRDDDEIITTQYIAKNANTYADEVIYDVVPADWQIWSGPALDDDSTMATWDISNKNEVHLTDNRYVLLEPLPKLNIKSHLDSIYFTLKDNLRYACYNKIVTGLSDIEYESDCYDVFGWSYTPIYESFDTEAIASADSRYIEGTVYNWTTNSDIYPMYHQKVSFIEYKNDDGSALNMLVNTHLPNYIFTNMLSTQSITAARRDGYTFLGWTGTGITDVPYKTGSIDLYNITDMTTRTYVAHWEKVSGGGSGGGGGGSSGGGGGGGPIFDTNGEVMPGGTRIDIDVDKVISTEVVNSLNKKAQDLIQENEIVKRTIENAPASILVLRDYAYEFKDGMTDVEIYFTIQSHLSDYPTVAARKWDTVLGEEVPASVIFDTKKFNYYMTDMSDIPKGWWVGTPQANGRTTWYYYRELGKYTTGLLYLSGKYYYFNDQGQMQEGFVNVDGQTHYFSEEKGRNEGVLIPIEGSDDDFYSRSNIIYTNK